MLEALDRMPELKGPRVLLRKLRLSDTDDLFLVCRDEKVSRFVLWHCHASPDETRSYIRSVLRHYRMEEPAPWGLEYEGHIVGTIGFLTIDWEHRLGEVGFSMSSRVWNHGIMTEALRLVLEYGFRELELHRIEAERDVRNEACRHVLEKCGLVQEGVLRGRLYNKGEFIDIAIHGTLQDAWLAANA